MTTHGMNDDTGEMTCRMFNNAQYRIIPTTIHPGGSIGSHRQASGDDLNYVISGTGKAICDGVKEENVFDYGAPIGSHIAVKPPKEFGASSVRTETCTRKGSARNGKRGPEYWRNPPPELRERYISGFVKETVIGQYTFGTEEDSMKYRTNRRTGDRISEIGLGSAYMCDASMDEAVRALRAAYEGGVNYYDLGAGNGKAFGMWREAFVDVRKNVFYQVHFGADYSKGAYGWSLDLETVKRSVDWMMRELDTDTIDYGMIHCQDEDSDWETYRKNGVYDYLREMQECGAVRHIGLSSHTPSVVRRILDEAPVDMLLFSVNPAYDYGHGEFANGGVDERAEIYRRCERDGIGISVMKPFSGGQLLDAARSPFRRALTPYQCIRYALDKPGVLTVLPGAQSAAEVRALLAYCDQPEEATDYSVIGGFAPVEASGKCVYCNHCMPCPAGLDIGLVNKYYDLARAGDAMAAGHYGKLDKTAADCVGCGHCDRRCPFHVKQSGRMREIAAYFGK